MKYLGSLGILVLGIIAIAWLALIVYALYTFATIYPWYLTVLVGAILTGTSVGVKR